MPVIGTAGHVDHGKSTLVQALTGIDPDRLREEKERGLTIDLGFAWLDLPSGLEVGIVDVPGHERFIKNMLAGAGGIDLVLLVVAADEGPRPQTEEHLAILDLLEVPGGIVVITKCDLAEAEYVDLVEAELEEHLKGSRLEGAPVLRVSAATGAGLEHLKLAIDAALAAMPPKRDSGRPRLPIDRAFTIKGFGAVVTGTLVDGWFAVGEEVEVVPGGARCRIRGLQRHRTKVESLGPGTRAAVNLSGIREEDLHRGLTIARPGAVETATSLVVRLRASRILIHPLAHEAEVTVLCATAEAQARLRLLDADALERGTTAWAQLVLSAPLPAVAGDHLVIRTPNETIAGGRVVAINGRRLRRNHPPTLEALEQRSTGSPEARILEALRAGPRVAGLVAAAAGLEPEKVSGFLESLTSRGDIFESGGTFCSEDWLATKSSELGQALNAYLTANNLRSAVPREHARGAIHLEPEAFELLVSACSARGLIEARGVGIAPAGYVPSPTAAQQAELNQFLQALRAQPFSPPTERLPAPPLLAYLAEQRLVEDTGNGVVFEAAVFADMVRMARAHLAVNGSITMAEARDLFGNSRKYAQAFLEHLDALQITRRAGDIRTLR